MNNFYKHHRTLNLVKIITLYNAIILGWKIRKLSNNAYELSKDMIDDSPDIELGLFLDKIVPDIDI